MKDAVHVYIIAQVDGQDFASPCKIGIAGDVKKRLKQIQTASPFRVGVYKVYAFPHRDIALQIEGMFHRGQSPKRLHGEWFNFEPDQAALWMNLTIELAIMENMAQYPKEYQQTARELIFGGS